MATPEATKTSHNPLPAVEADELTRLAVMLSARASLPEMPLFPEGTRAYMVYLDDDKSPRVAPVPKDKSIVNVRSAKDVMSHITSAPNDKAEMRKLHEELGDYLRECGVPETDSAWDAYSDRLYDVTSLLEAAEAQANEEISTACPLSRVIRVAREQLHGVINDWDASQLPRSPRQANRVA
jgi:hypothetical protein